MVMPWAEFGLTRLPHPQKKMHTEMLSPLERSDSLNMFSRGKRHDNRNSLMRLRQASSTTNYKIDKVQLCDMSKTFM